MKHRTTFNAIIQSTNNARSTLSPISCIPTVDISGLITCSYKKALASKSML